MTCLHTDRRQQPDGTIVCEQCGANLGRMVHTRDGQRYTVPVLDDRPSEARRLRRLDRVR